MKLIQFAAIAGVTGLLAACAQQEETTMVKPQPVYDKFGSGSCEGELIYIPGTVPQLDECIPPDECEPVYDTAGNIIECPPPRTSRNPNPDGSHDDGGRTPSSGTAGTPTGSTGP